MPKNSSKRKKKGPWNPSKNIMPEKVAKDLGLPVERLRQSKAGFEPESTGIGHFRLKEKAMLTHPSLLAERTNTVLRAYADQGRQPDKEIQITQTPSDRVTAMWRKLLWDCLLTIYERQGNAGVTDYEGSPRASELHRLPFNDSQFNRRKFLDWLSKQPGWRTGTSFLEKIAAQCNPQAFNSDRLIMSKAEIGMWRIDTDSSRDAKCAVDGALAQICEMMAEAAADFAASERLRKLETKNGKN